MKGRTEHNIKTENIIMRLLNDMPQCAVDYYYNISSSREPKSCEEYIKKLRSFFLFIDEDMKNINFKNIKEPDISRYMHKISTKVNSNGEIEATSFSYRKMNHTILNSFFEYLYGVGFIDRNPVKMIKRPSSLDQIERRYITDDDFNTILQSVRSGVGSEKSKQRQDRWRERDLAIMLLFMSTGMRETALCEINIEDVDLESNIIKIIDKRHTYHEFYIDGKVKKSIERWIVRRQTILNGKNCDALFISNQKKRITQNTVSALVEKYSYDAIGVKLSPHKLRSAFITILYKDTGDIEFVRDAVGHRSVSVTQRYIASDGKTKQRASSIINAKIK